MNKALLISFLLITFFAQAQFNADAPVVISPNDAGAAYAVPHIVAADSGYFVSWYDEHAGYEMYLQYIDPLGNLVWEQPALVTNYPQDSWISDYALVTDGRHAYIFFSDTRNGDTDKDIFGYKFNTAGESLWGEAGIELVVASSDYDAELAPKAVMLGNGNVVSAWTKMDAAGYTVDMQWLRPDGTTLWENGNLIAETGKRIYEPNLVAAGDTLVYLVYIFQDGQYGDRQIYAQLIDPSGQNQWDAPILITTDSGIGMGRSFTVQSAPNNGLIVAWYGDPDFNSVNDVFAQYIELDGTVRYAEGGLNLAVNDALNQTDLQCIGVSPDGHAVFTWQDANANYSVQNVNMQMVDAQGNLLMGAAGKLVLANYITADRGSARFGNAYIPVQAGQSDPLEMLVYDMNTSNSTLTPMNMNWEDISTFGNGQLVVVDIAGTQVRVQNFTHDAQIGSEAVLNETGLASLADMPHFQPDSLFYFSETDRFGDDEFATPMNIYQTVTYLDEPTQALGNYRVKVQSASNSVRFYQYSIVEQPAAVIENAYSDMFFVTLDTDNQTLLVELQVTKNGFSHIDLTLSPGARLFIDDQWDADYSIFNAKIDSLIDYFDEDTTIYPFQIVDYENQVANWDLLFHIGGGSVSETQFGGRVYPNPAIDKLHIESVDVIDAITVLSLDGKVLKTVTCAMQAVSVDVSMLQRGMYLLSIEQGLGVSYSTFIKN